MMTRYKKTMFGVWILLSFVCIQSMNDSQSIASCFDLTKMSDSQFKISMGQFMKLEQIVDPCERNRAAKELIMQWQQQEKCNLHHKHLKKTLEDRRMQPYCKHKQLQDTIAQVELMVQKRCNEHMVLQYQNQLIVDLPGKNILKPYDKVMVAQHIGTTVYFKASISQSRLQKMYYRYIDEKTEFDEYVLRNTCKKIYRLQCGNKYNLEKQRDDISDNEVVNILADIPAKKVDSQINQGRETPAPLRKSSKKILKLSPTSVEGLSPAIGASSINKRS